MNNTDYISYIQYKDLRTFISFSKFCMLYFIIIVSFYDSPILPEEFKSWLFNRYIIITVSIFIMSIWLLYYRYIKKEENIKIIRTLQMFEDFVFIILLYFSTIITNTYKSSYKYLYLYIIITSTIFIGKVYGLIVAFLSSIVVLITDLLFIASNIHIRNNLILSVIFIIIAWFLGTYRELELNYINSLTLSVKEQLEQNKSTKDMFLKNEENYKLLIEDSHSAIIIHTQDKILFYNERFLEITGLNDISDLKNSILSLYDKENRENIGNKYKSIIESGAFYVYNEESIVNTTGKKIDIINISNYCFYQETPAVLTVIKNITYEELLNKLKREAQEGRRLLSNIKKQNDFSIKFLINTSHELKTPLNIIYSSIQMLDICDTEFFLSKKDKYLLAMKQNCHRLIRIVDNLLDITRCNTDDITLELRNEDIVNIIEDLSMSVISYTKQKNIELIFDTNIEEKIIAFDTEKIERVVLNLLSNALKYTNESGYIYINILDKEKYIEISVRDTGIGIPAEKQKSIFELFNQMDNSLKRNTEGIGIGLTLAKAFIELHDGEIEVHSEYGKGSEFIIKLPSIQIKDKKNDTKIKQSLTDKIAMELSDIYIDSKTDLY